MKQTSYYQITVRPPTDIARMIQEICEKDSRAAAEVVAICLQRQLPILTEEVRVKCRAIEEFRKASTKKQG